MEAPNIQNLWDAGVVRHHPDHLSLLEPHKGSYIPIITGPVNSKARP